jgi:hypothetical protein
MAQAGLRKHRPATAVQAERAVPAVRVGQVVLAEMPVQAAPAAAQQTASRAWAAMAAWAVRALMVLMAQS